MVVSTGERKRKVDEREYDTPPPLPCTLKELNVLLDKWIADRVLKPNQVSREPTEVERRDPRFCHLHNYVQHPTIESRKGLWSYPNWKFKETHSQTTKGRV